MAGTGLIGAVLGETVPAGLAFLMWRREAVRMENLLGCPFLVQDLSHPFEKLFPCMGGSPQQRQGGAPSWCSPSHCSTRSMRNIITLAKANPCWPWLLGRTPRKTVSLQSTRT